jgi:hypothetical protein
MEILIVKTRTRSLFVALLAACALLSATGAEAKPKPKNPEFSVVPIDVTDVRLVDGQLVADIALGEVTQTIPITNVSVSPAQAPLTCPILHLELEIDRLDLLGLVVELDDCDEGPVVVDVAALPGGGLLGDLLCGLLGGLNLNLPINLDDLLAQLTPAQVTQLLDIIERILDAVLARATSSTTLAGAVAQANDTCTILDLQLGPINLNLLGLLVETSPICLSLTAEEGGGLLGDLLCTVANLLNNDNVAARAVYVHLLQLNRAILAAAG